MVFRVGNSPRIRRTMGGLAAHSASHTPRSWTTRLRSVVILAAPLALSTLAHAQGSALPDSANPIPVSSAATRAAAANAGPVTSSSAGAIAVTASPVAPASMSAAGASATPAALTPPSAARGEAPTAPPAPSSKPALARSRPEPALEAREYEGGPIPKGYRLVETREWGAAIAGGVLVTIGGVVAAIGSSRQKDCSPGQAGESCQQDNYGNNLAWGGGALAIIGVGVIVGVVGLTSKVRTLEPIQQKRAVSFDVRSVGATGTGVGVDVAF
jgi:hypothetical protein